MNQLLIVSEASNNNKARISNDLALLRYRKLIKLAEQYGITVKIASSNYGLIQLYTTVEPYITSWTPKLANWWSVTLETEVNNLFDQYYYIGIALKDVEHKILEHSTRIWQLYLSGRATRLRNANDVSKWINLSRL